MIAYFGGKRKGGSLRCYYGSLRRYYGKDGKERKKTETWKPNPKPNPEPDPPNTWPIIQFFAHSQGWSLSGFSLPMGEKFKSATLGF